MPNTSQPDFKTIIADPDFHALPLDEKQKVLVRIDPDYAGLPAKEQMKVLDRIQYGATEGPQGSAVGRFGTAVWGDIKNYAKSVPQMAEMLPNSGVGVGDLRSAASDVERSRQQFDQAAQLWGSEKQAGYSLPYRVSAQVAQPLGLDVRGMEDAARTGDAATILGHTVAPTALATSSYWGPPVARAAEVPARAIETGVRATAQEALGVGPQLTREAQAERLAEIAKRQAGYESDLADAQTKQDVARNANVSNYRAAEQELEQKRGQVSAQNESAQETWRGNAQKAIQLRDSQAKMAARRDALQRGAEELQPRIQQHIQNVHDSVRADLDGRWDDLRDKVGNDTVDTKMVQAAIQNARDKIIAGSPDGIKLFDRMLNSDKQPIVVDGVQLDPSRTSDAALIAKLRESGALPPEGKMSFNDARGFYTELGDLMNRGGLPGDAYRAIKSVRMALDQAISKTVDAHGALGDYQDVKGDWKDYEKTFKNTGSLAKGGSPLAHSLAATDPGYAMTALTGKASDRALSLLGQYKDFGGNPALLQRYLGIQDELKGLPKSQRVVSVPRMPEDKPLPDMSVAPYKPLPSLPEPPDEPAAVDPRALKAARIGQIAGRMRAPNFWQDVVIPAAGVAGHSHYGLPAELAVALPLVRRLAGAALESRPVVNWLSTPRAADIAAILRDLKLDPNRVVPASRVAASRPEVAATLRRIGVAR